MSYSLSKIADFQNCLISRVFGVFLRGFLHRTTVTFLKNGFLHVFGILIFDPNLAFCQGYSLCMGYSVCKMADFQNCLISRIFGISLSGFLQRKTVTFLKNRFSHIFGIFNF